MGSKRLKMDIQTASKGECPVCFQIPRGKIINICLNGHYLCEACSIKVTNCPECRSPGTKVRNLLAERLLDGMEIKCSWSGCDETMNRGELSDHEDHCNKNPDTVPFCSLLLRGGKVHFKFTPKWLTEPDNCMDLLSHVKACLGYHCQGITKFGSGNCLDVGLKTILPRKYIPSRTVNFVFDPLFHRLELPNRDKVELFFIIPLVNVDKSGHIVMSFAFVQLTPETTPVVVKFTINGSPSSKMNSQWGHNSLPSQSWTQKTIGFGQFVEMVQPSRKGPETGISFPFSFPVSFLSEFYLDEDNNLNLNYTLEKSY